jgi:hypothetical protein
MGQVEVPLLVTATPQMLEPRAFKVNVVAQFVGAV